MKHRIGLRQAQAARSLSRADPGSGSRRIGVLISGRGSNLQALIDAIVAHAERTDRDRDLEQGGCSRTGSGARRGIETMALDHRGFPSRDDYDATVANELRSRGVSLVCLAGFMRLVGPRLLCGVPGCNPQHPPRCCRPSRA
jgi:folate-dependent phosphoribosylglycinamide formyltransferase PurN